MSFAFRWRPMAMVATGAGPGHRQET